MSEAIDVNEVLEPSDLDVSAYATFRTRIGTKGAKSYQVITPLKKSSKYISFADTGRVSFSDALLEEVVVLTGDDDTSGENEPSAGD